MGDLVLAMMKISSSKMCKMDEVITLRKEVKPVDDQRSNGMTSEYMI